MATIAQHFERLCECLETAEDLSREEAANYLAVVLNTIRDTPRNRQLRIWFMQATLALLERKVDEPASVS